MWVTIAPIQIKAEYKEQFIKEIVDDARGSVNDEPGCMRFDVIQDANDPNRIWLYEVYRDEAAAQAHTQAPHFKKYQAATMAGTDADWRDLGVLQGAGRGASNIWPQDNEWK